MAKIDSKGRVVLPQRIRERLGLDPGSEVNVHEEDGRAVVAPEESAAEIIDDLEQRIERAASRREQTPYDELNAEAREHVETIRRQASDTRIERDGTATDE